MKLLIVATKAPWPALDGGRLLLARTLEGLAALGIRPTLVAPVDPRDGPLASVEAALTPWCEARLVPVRLAGRLRTIARVARSGAPWSIARHRVAAIGTVVRRCLADGSVDLIHAEQLQAFTEAEAAAGGKAPVVLRTQNVESDLWSAAAGRGWLRAEALRLARWEGSAVGRAALTVALSSQDSDRLASLASEAGSPRDVAVLPPPFPEVLPAGAEALAGSPAVVLMGSAGWYPNREAAERFIATAWPAVLGALPGALLHVFGDLPGVPRSAPGIHWHAAPLESVTAFAAGAVLVVPLRIGSGVRMKILEAWARGLPVVASPEAIAGLDGGDAALVARDASQFAAAFVRLQSEPGLASALVANGRRLLRQNHDPAEAAQRLVALYERALGGRA